MVKLNAVTSTCVQVPDDADARAPGSRGEGDRWYEEMDGDSWNARYLYNRECAQDAEVISLRGAEAGA